MALRTVLSWFLNSSGWVRRNVYRVAAFVAGLTLPTALNTGLITNRASLTVVEAEQSHSTNGATYQNTWFKGGVVIDAVGVTYINCSFAYQTGTARAGSVTVNSTATGILFFRCECAPHSVVDRNKPLNGITCALGCSITVTQCYFEGCNDSIYGSGAIINRGNYADWFCFNNNDTTHASDSRHPSWVHCDFVQLRSGSLDALGDRVCMRYHPTLGAGAAAAGTLADGGPNEHNSHAYLINVASNTDRCTYNIRKAWIERGENALLLTGTNTRTDNDGSFTDNRVGSNTALSFGSHHTQVAVDRSKGTFTQSGNVYWDDPDATPNAALRGQPLPWGFDGTSDYSRWD